MYSTLATLVNRLDSSSLSRSGVIRWCCPVPSFGNLARSSVATLGLNPSNREFVDESGNELQGVSRRFHTLKSLGLRSWADADARHLRSILESCRAYFAVNPYDRWFKRLDQAIAGTRSSFYHAPHEACHLDLIPYATACKWTELSQQQRDLLLAASGDTLGVLLRDSPVRVLVLNGRAVVEQFQNISGIRLDREWMSSWSLPRRSGIDVPGIAYKGTVDKISGIRLSHEILVLGFNHNLQSSFGVTTKAVDAIRDWIAQASKEIHQ